MPIAALRAFTDEPSPARFLRMTMLYALSLLFGLLALFVPLSLFYVVLIVCSLI